MAQRDFLHFAIKRILTSGNLVKLSGEQCELAAVIAGVNPGENFVSLDACADSVIASLRSQYEREKRQAAA
ncbi:MAG: hypothetical protein A2X94_07525 [Bdellovibrionales bacterium GWB1_55_8]|nr:MAG: hypothetical protein A2X94_07525 [Bdellovibrionales bacterium GWB1_55_8]